MKQTFTHQSLNIEISPADDGSALQMIWGGKSNARSPLQILEPVFQEAQAYAAEAKLPLEMHFQDMEHFNSSTITALIALIQQLRDSKVQLRLHYNAALKWQKMSFDALKVFETPDGMLQIFGKGEA